MKEKTERYANTGRDEEGHAIGNCKDCGLHGVPINRHKCRAETIKEIAALQRKIKELERRLAVLRGIIARETKS